MIDSELSSIFKSCADSIRSKGVSGTFLPSELSSGINQIQTGTSKYQKKDWKEDGKSHLYLQFSEIDNEYDFRRDVYITFYLSSQGVTTINWGDGTTTQLSSPTSVTNKSATHRYLSADDYEITIEGYDSISASLQCLGGGSGWDARPNGARVIRQMEFDLKGGKLTNGTPYNNCEFVKVRNNYKQLYSRICVTYYNLKEYIDDGCSSLYEYSFHNSCGVEKVYMPNLIHTGVSIFSGCGRLSSFTCSPQISSIGNYAFRNCSNLKSETVEQFSNVQTLGCGSFEGCSCLTYLPDLCSLTAIVGEPSSSAGITKNTQISSVGCINNVVSFGGFTFSHNPNLKYVGEMPLYTGLLQNGCFYGATNLVSASIPNCCGCTSWGQQFYNCRHIELINLGNLSAMGNSTFGNIGIDNQPDQEGIKCTVNVKNSIQSLRAITGYRFPFSAPTSTKFVCSDGYIKYVNNQWTDFYT